MALMVQAQRNARYHTVEEGQTLYSIARLYSVSPGELMRLNPKSGDLIKPGDKLRIPDTAAPVVTGPGAQFVGTTTESTPRPTSVSRCKQMYQVKKKDNLYRISLDFNLTLQELVAANPGIKADSKLQKGDWLCIPYSKAELQMEAHRLAAEQAASAASSKLVSHKSHLNAAVILPLKENTDRGGKMIEFYQGLLMAVDSVRKQGTSIDIYAYHSGNGLAELNSILAREEMKHMDVIFGPLDGVQATVLNNFSKQHRIRLVMPFATTNTYGSNNPYAYVVSAQADLVNKIGASSITRMFASHNIVVLNAGQPDNRGTNFVVQLTQELNAHGLVIRTLNADADEAIYCNTLHQTRNNLVVVNNSSQTAIQKATRKLREFLRKHPEYRVSLVGYPEWSTYQAGILQDFHALDTYAYTPFFRNSSDIRIQAFERRFKANFGHDLIVVSPRYGLLGMDLGYFFLHGLAQLGDYFDERQHTLKYSPLQSDFQFAQNGAGMPYINRQVNLVHYAPSGNTEVLKQK